MNDAVIGNMIEKLDELLLLVEEWESYYAADFKVRAEELIDYLNSCEE